MKTETTTENLVRVTSSRSLDEIGDRLPVVAKAYKFGVLGMHDLKEKMKSKGIDFEAECRVFDICNPQQAKEILTESMEVASVLPCRIAAYEKDGSTVLAMLKPTRLLSMFSIDGGEEIARDVEATLIRIMRETAESEE